MKIYLFIALASLSLVGCASNRGGYSNDTYYRGGIGNDAGVLQGAADENTFRGNIGGPPPEINTSRPPPLYLPDGEILQ
jgi:hypothetical protein